MIGLLRLVAHVHKSSYTQFEQPDATSSNQHSAIPTLSKHRPTGCYPSCTVAFKCALSRFQTNQAFPTMQSSPPSTESATALTLSPTSDRVDHALAALEHNSYTRRRFAIGVSTSVSSSLWLAWVYPTSHVVHAPACPAKKPARQSTPSGPRHNIDKTWCRPAYGDAWSAACPAHVPTYPNNPGKHVLAVMS